MRSVPVTVTAKMRLRPLWEAVKRYGTNKAVAAALGMSANEFSSWLNMRSGPGKWRREDMDFRTKFSLVIGAELTDVFPEGYTEAVRRRRLPKWLEKRHDVPLENLLYPGKEALMLPPAQENDLIRAEKVDAVKAALDQLPRRDREILKMRFGLDGNGERTLKEIAHVFGVHHERIRQIEVKALRKLRHPSRSRNLRGLEYPCM